MISFAGAALRVLLSALLLAGVTTPSSAAEVVVRGAGATFPFPVYASWAHQYRRETGVEVSYAPVGSGAGIKQIEQRLIDFGASDVLLAPAELRRLGLLQFPVVIGGVVPVINIRGVKSGELRLSGRVLGDIYLGRVLKWNDAAITELNPGLDLPSSNITVVQRADASGTTFLWSDFLSRSNPEWQARFGAAMALNWPVGVADVGNEGVASSVQRTKMSIGYVEYAYAKAQNLSLVSLRNRHGQFVAPSRAAFEAAAAAARWQSDAELDSLLIDPPGAASWPITGASFVLLRTRPGDPAPTVEAMRFFDWAWRHGQQLALDLDYLPLPATAVRQIERWWAENVRRPDGGAVWPPSPDPVH